MKKEINLIKSCEFEPLRKNRWFAKFIGFENKNDDDFLILNKSFCLRKLNGIEVDSKGRYYGEITIEYYLYCKESKIIDEINKLIQGFNKQMLLTVNLLTSTAEIDYTIKIPIKKIKGYKISNLDTTNDEIITLTLILEPNKKKATY